MKGFKKDFSYYFIGIIIPGIGNFLSIPVLKFLLGTENYGIYSINYNIFLLLVGSLAGWLGLSIVRFKTSYIDEDLFYCNIFKLTFLIGASCAIIFATSIYFLKSSFLLSVLIAVSFFLAYLHNNMLAVTQSNFLSRVTPISESLRTLFFFGSFIILVGYNKDFVLEKLFLSLSFGYFSSFLFLKKRNKISFRKLKKTSQSSVGFNFKEIFSYGVPIGLLICCNYLINFIDKPFLAAKFGQTEQGNYQAIFDMIFRGTGILLTPIITASFPYMSKLKNSNEANALTSFFKQLIIGELILFTLGILGYAFFASLILRILRVPYSNSYFWLGFFVFFAAFIGQFSTLLQKSLELEQKTLRLLINNVIAVCVSALCLLFLHKINAGILWYPLCILSGSATYATMCVWQGLDNKKLKANNVSDKTINIA